MTLKLIYHSSLYVMYNHKTELVDKGNIFYWPIIITEKHWQEFEHVSFLYIWNRKNIFQGQRTAEKNWSEYQKYHIFEKKDNR